MKEAVCARAQMLSVIEIVLNTCPFTDVACIWAKPATCVGRVLRFRISATGGSVPPQPW